MVLVFCLVGGQQKPWKITKRKDRLIKTLGKPKLHCCLFTVGQTPVFIVHQSKEFGIVMKIAGWNFDFFP
jgi:hypothetical protein